MTLLADPAIVHFTGELHPSMSSMLNDSFQPWVSKPWGYSGAPGNPFAENWWEVLKITTWKGIWQDKMFRENLIIAKKAVVKAALAELERRVLEGGIGPRIHQQNTISLGKYLLYFYYLVILFHLDFSYIGL